MTGQVRAVGNFTTYYFSRITASGNLPVRLRGRKSASPDCDRSGILPIAFNEKITVPEELAADY